MIILQFVLFVVIAVVGAGALYALYSVIHGYLSARYAPREDMFFCQKHGFMRKEHMIEFMGTPACSICFHMNLVEAEKFRSHSQKGQIVN